MELELLLLALVVFLIFFVFTRGEKFGVPPVLGPQCFELDAVNPQTNYSYICDFIQTTGELPAVSNAVPNIAPDPYGTDPSDNNPSGLVGVTFTANPGTPVTNKLFNRLSTAIISDFSGVCSSNLNMHAYTDALISSLPPTCSNLFASFPSGTPEIKNTLRTFICNPDDTLRSNALDRFITRAINYNICGNQVPFGDLGDDIYPFIINGRAVSNVYSNGTPFYGSSSQYNNQNVTYKT